MCPNNEICYLIQYSAGRVQGLILILTLILLIFIFRTITDQRIWMDNGLQVACWLCRRICGPSSMVLFRYGLFLVEASCFFRGQSTFKIPHANYCNNSSECGMSQTYLVHVCISP